MRLAPWTSVTNPRSIRASETASGTAGGAAAADTAACVAACTASPAAATAFSAVSDTLGAGLPAGSDPCTAACDTLAAHRLARAAGAQQRVMCGSGTGSATASTTSGATGGAVTHAAADPARLAAAALDTVEAALGASARATLTPAGGGMTPSAALAADALAGSFRVRQPADGWVRISTASPCLALPADHGLHDGVGEEWYFVVGVLTARENTQDITYSGATAVRDAGADASADAGAATGTDAGTDAGGDAGGADGDEVRISFCWMLDVHTLVPRAGPGGVGVRVADAQFALGEEGAPNVASAAALWDGVTPLITSASPLRLRMGGMALEEETGGAVGSATGSATGSAAQPPPDGMGALRLRATSGARGTQLDIRLTRDPATAPFVPQGPRGVIGDAAHGNGYLYYSAPFLAVAPGGTVTSVGADGVARSRRVTGGLAWFDHQLGTVGAPQTGGATLDAVVALVPRAVPVVDRGFGIVGQENWFGLMWTRGALAGRAFMGTVVVATPVARLSGGALSGNWIIPDGSGGATVVAVRGGVADATATVVDVHGGTVASAFRLVLPPPEVGGPPLTLYARTLAADGAMAWAKGDAYWESALVLEDDSHAAVGYGWAEQVGWWHDATARLLGTCGMTDAATVAAAVPRFESPPRAARARGALLLVGLLLAALALLAVPIALARHAHAHAHAARGGRGRRA